MVLVVLGDVVGVAYVEMSCHVLAQVQIRVLGLGLDNKYFFTEKLFSRFGLSGCVSPTQNMSFRVHWPLLAHSREEKVYGLPLYHAKVA